MRVAPGATPFPLRGIIGWTIPYPAMQPSSTLTHVNPEGGVRMVDVSAKSPTAREAEAAGRVIVGSAAYRALTNRTIKKGDVLGAAQIAGIMGAKKASALLPLCHSIALTSVDVDFKLVARDCAVDIRASARSVGPTGVEMEVLTAVSIAALTIYDMCKSVSKAIRITDVRLVSKAGGKSGSFRMDDA